MKDNAKVVVLISCTMISSSIVWILNQGLYFFFFLNTNVATMIDNSPIPNLSRPG